MPGSRALALILTPTLWRWPTPTAKRPGGGSRRFEVAARKRLYPRPSSIILTNPPYGERLGDAAEAAALARTLGQVWQAKPHRRIVCHYGGC